MSKSSVISARKILQDSLTRRTPTWTVADAILKLEVVTDKSSKLHQELSSLAEQARWSYGQMSDDFDLVDPADTQLVTFAELFPSLNVEAAAAETVYGQGYLSAYQGLLQDGLDFLGVPAGFTAAQALQGRYSLDWTVGKAGSKKAFTKRVRFLASFEEKVARVADTLQLRHAQMQAKSRLAYAVDVTKVDDLSLSFIAYLTARANRRSLFMLGGQSKAFDTITDGLLGLMGKDSAWEQVAYVSPTTNVFSQLDGETLGRLSGVFHKKMVAAATVLGELFPALPERMRKEMVMVKGVDSSRWNAYAGALNTMRSAWISATLASGLGGIFNSYLPGKSPRLMAADVVWWAREMGEELHEDTRMFSLLPYPWEVVAGDKGQTRESILAVAEKEKVDAVKSGWVGPRAKVEREVASAEPATVHGVVVSDPALAVVLRKAGVFSAQKLRDSAIPEEGFVKTETFSPEGKIRVEVS